MEDAGHDDVEAFEAHRPALTGLAYRMLGDLGRAEDVVQEAWLRWNGRIVSVDEPRGYLVQVVTRLCLNELTSARARREESRSDRLPEPVDLEASGLDQAEMLDRISMAFLVLLQRLTPLERAVLLLHDVFDLRHAEIARMLDRSEAACRQLLSRARNHVQHERRVFETSPDQHREVLAAFLRAFREGATEDLLALLTDDATLIIDAGPGGRRVGRIRSVSKPVHGARRIAALLSAVVREGQMTGPYVERVLNGQPSIIRIRDGRAVTVVSVGVAEGKIHSVFVQVDPSRLGHLGSLQ